MPRLSQGPEHIQNPGIFERIGDTFRNSHLGQMATGAVAALTLGAGVETVNLALDPTPVAAENVPTQISTTPSSLKEQCASDIFTQPQILEADMHNPGKEYQDFFVHLGFGPVNAACEGRFKRLASMRNQLRRHGHIINEDQVWVSLLSEGDTNAAGDPGLDDLNSHQVPKLYYRKGDKAQFKLRLQEYSVAAKKVVKTVIKTYPIKVHHN